MKDGEAAKVTYLHNALGQRVFKSEIQVEQTLPDEEELGLGFVDWLRKNFKWLFLKASTNASVGTAYMYADGQLPSWALLGEYDNGSSTGAGRSEYIWLPTPDGAIPVGMFRNGKLFAIHADHLGTPRLMTNESNTPVWQWPYSAFGNNKPTGVLKATPKPRQAMTIQPEMLKATAPTELNLRMPGQYYDSETGAFYNYFRQYDPRTGRYTQSDPIGLDGGWNRFGYVGGNSLSYLDPLGLAKHNPSSAYCQDLRKKIQKGRNEVAKRLQELEADKLGLPERLANPKNEAFSATRRGHRTLMNIRDSQTRELEKKYDEECGDDNNDQGDSCNECTAGAVAATMVGGYLVYRCVRMLPSVLLPPLWPTIPANALLP